MGSKHSQPFASNAGLPSVNPVVYGKVDWLATVRGRLGVALSPTLVYVTLALPSAAWIWLGYGGTFNSVPVHVLDRSQIGWVAGGGIEHAFAGMWSVRAEVLITISARILGRSITAAPIQQRSATA